MGEGVSPATANQTLLAQATTAHKPSPAQEPEPKRKGALEKPSVVHAARVPKDAKQISPWDEAKAALETVGSTRSSYQQTRGLADSGDPAATAQLGEKRSAFDAACNKFRVAIAMEMTATVGPNTGRELLQNARYKLMNRAEGIEAKVLVGAAAFQVIRNLEAAAADLQPAPKVRVEDLTMGGLSSPLSGRQWDPIERAAKEMVTANDARYQALVALKATRHDGHADPKAEAVFVQKLAEYHKAQKELELIIVTGPFNADAITNHFAGRDIDIQTMISDTVRSDPFER
jgi:hypothetical protein